MKESSSGPRKVSLGEGQSWSITLPGLGGAGYVWEHRVEGDGDVISLTRDLGDGPRLPPAGDEPPASYSRDAVFTITGRRAGKVRVSFLQKRPWEAERPPFREVVVDVEVVAAP